MKIDPVRLTVFHELFAAIAEEMGDVLAGTAPSVNIRERLDYSCAIFDSAGRLVSQAAHIPVHLGSAALSVRAARERFADLAEGDAVLLNDPYAGGTHLPDLTLVSAVGNRDPWYLVTRAHHSDVGGSQPGSMAPAADLPAEGLRIPPVLLLQRDEWVPDVLAFVLANTRTPRQREGDLRAQVHANRLGGRRLHGLWRRYGRAACAGASAALHDYTARLVRGHLATLRPGAYTVEDRLEGDGVVSTDLRLVLTLVIRRGARLTFDFSRTVDQAPGCMNANPAITLAAVLYALCCVVPDDVPVNAGLLHHVEVRTRAGSLLEAQFPAAVAGGNVETSQRLVDLCMAALGQAGADVAAQSSGTMNNLSFGGTLPQQAGPFAFYETIGGGAGASRKGAGASGVHTHMTNTRNTPIEECELELPVVVDRYSLRRGSGGRGSFRGGDGILKVLRALVPMRVSILAERRRHPPRGRHGGGAGRPGAQFKVGSRRRALPAKGSFVLDRGDRLRIETPGGGGWGKP